MCAELVLLSIGKYSSGIIWLQSAHDLLTCQWLMGTTSFGRETRVERIDRNEWDDSIMGVDQVKIDTNHYGGEEYLAPKDIRLGNRNSTFLLL